MNDENERQVYERPMLRRVELKTDEVLAAGCKTLGAPAPASLVSCSANSCATDGS